MRNVSCDARRFDDPSTVSPSTPTLEAITVMREHRVGCRPVVEVDQLVGIVTSFDFLDASARLFQQRPARKETVKIKKMAQSA